MPYPNTGAAGNTPLNGNPRGAINFAGDLTQFSSANLNDFWQATQAGTIGGISFVAGDIISAMQKISATPTDLSLASGFAQTKQIFPDATTLVKGTIQLSGDIGGAASNLIVNQFSGVAVPPSNAASAGKYHRSTSATSSAWSTIQSSDLPVATNSSLGATQPDNSSISINGSGILSVKPATSSNIGGIIPDGTILTVTGTGAASVAQASNSAYGVVKTDGSTINSSSGVISAASSSSSQLGVIKLAGDLGGSATLPLVAKINGVTVPSVSPTANQVLQATNSTTAVWATIPNATIATTSTAGIVKPDGASVLVDANGVITVPSASSSTAGIAKVDNSTIKMVSGALTATTATSTQLGVVSPDGSVITNTNGNITVPVATTAKIGVVQVDGVTLGVDANGKISSKIAAAVYTVAASQSAMLALYSTAQTNLVICTRTDNNHIYYLNAGSNPTLSVNWTDGGSTVGAVQSFNTRNGAVVPVAGDYNAYIAPFNKANVYNPNECCIYNSVAYVCTAQTTANANWASNQWSQIVPSDSTKANIASPAFTGTPTAPTATAKNNSTQLATTAYVDAAASVQFVGGQSVTLKNVSVNALSTSYTCDSTTGLIAGMQFNDGSQTQTVVTVSTGAFTTDKGAGASGYTLSSVIASNASSAVSGIVPAPTVSQISSGNVLTTSGWGAISTKNLPLASYNTLGLMIPDPNCMTTGIGTGQVYVTGFNNVSVSNQPSGANQVLLSTNSTGASWGAIPSTAAATSGALGTIQMTGDLGGSGSAPTIAKINGVSVPASAPTANQYYKATSATASSWGAIAASDLPAASSTVQGAVKVGGVTPSALGTASPGSSIVAAAADHVHPTPATIVGATMKLYSSSDNFQSIPTSAVTTINLGTAASFSNTTYFTNNGDGGIKVNQACVILISANLTMDAGTLAVNSAALETRRTLIVTAGSITLGSNVCYMPKSQTDLGAMTFSTTHVVNSGDIVYIKAYHGFGVNISCRVAYGFGCDLSVQLLRLGTST